MDTRCSKCYISKNYYKSNRSGLNCRYHSTIRNGCCTRCHSRPGHFHNCYHTWEGPCERTVNNLLYFFRKVCCWRF